MAIRVWAALRSPGVVTSGLGVEVDLAADEDHVAAGQPMAVAERNADREVIVRVKASPWQHETPS